MTESCSTCIYYKAENSAYGDCRRYPVYEDKGPRDWCGEYSARTAPSKTAVVAGASGRAGKRETR